MRIVLLVLLSILSTQLFARQTAPPEMPVVTLVPGQQPKAVWSNGNEAELKFSRSVESKTSVPFQVTENLCTQTKPDTFKFVVPFRIDRLAWFWSKHLDSAKVGKLLKFKVANFESDMLRVTPISNGHFAMHSDLLLGLPEDQIEFNDLKWLPGLENGVLRPFTIDTWMSEAMYPNLQNGVMENRVIGGAYGVHLQPVTALTAKIDNKSSGFILPFVRDSLLFFGDVVSWNLQSAKGACQITFKPNISVAVKEVGQFENGLKDPYVPYIWRQDTLSETAEPQFFMESLRYAQ